MIKGSLLLKTILAFTTILFQCTIKYQSTFLQNSEKATITLKKIPNQTTNRKFMVRFVKTYFTNDLLKCASSQTNLKGIKDILKKQTLSVIKFAEIKPK